MFQLNDYKIIENHYFPLIRYLIINGLLDETYWYYKGNFDIDSSNTLKRNDLVYKKGLLESQKLDVFLKLETPNEVLNRLDILDFNRSNILNRDILQACLEEEKTEFIIELMNTVDSNNSYRNLVRILETFDLEIIRKFVDVLVRDNADKLLNVLTLCYKLYSSTFRDILISIFITGLVPAHSLEIFRWYIEENEELISLISEEDFEIFIYNINNIGAKFNSLSKINIDKDRLIQIEQKQAFKLNVQNFIAITEKVLEKKIHYGNLLNEIYKSNLLSVSKNYIADNFNIFITGYIDENQNGELFTNDEKILIQILESEIDIDYKIKYLEKNKTILTNLTSIEEKSLSKEILDCLLNKNTIKFSSENIKKCWSLINVVSEKFASYINQNLKIDNSETVLANDELICKEFINSPLINDKSFELIIDYVNKAIDNINPKLSRARVKALAKSNLIGTTLENLQVLLENSYIEEIIWLVNSADIEVENEVISILLTQNLSEDLIYDLVNNDISDENGKQLLELIRDRISVERIDSQKIAIIEEILDEEISIENINYICGHFSEFNLKEKFLENLIVRGMLETLNNENLNQEFMRYTLDSGIVSLDTKISLIVRKIESGTPVEELEDYFDSIEEIKDLSGVWNHKRPLLDSYWKEHIGEALDKAKYVKKRNDQKGCRIEKR